MPEPTLLGQITLGYGAVIDRQRAVVATRLTVTPEQPEAAIDAAALLAAFAEVWPESGGALSLQLRPVAAGGAAAKATAGVPLIVAASGEPLLRALLAAPAVPRFMIEVPAFLAGDAAMAQAIVALRDAGGTLALRGRPREPLPAALGPCFVLHIDDDAAAATARGGSVPWLRAGVTAPADLDAAFKAGAAGAIGWPFGDAPAKATGKAIVAPELQVILELINRVDREESIDRLEAVLKNDPTLAFRLIRYINSPGFGLSVEISSFRHALMILGYHKLKRWLALLLASGSKDANQRPVMYAAVRRGLLMEELVRTSGDADLRGEIFICGVFSLLDRLLRQPFAELLRAVPVPRRVQQALLGEEGPFLPYLELVQAIESGVALDIRERAGALMLGPAEINRALLGALAAAAQLDR